MNGKFVLWRFGKCKERNKWRNAIFEVSTVVTGECRFLRYKDQVIASHELLYVSATEPSRLILHKIWSFRGGGYGDCRLLRYKDQITWCIKHFVSAAEPSRLMLCKIWGFHGGDCGECRLLRYKDQASTSQETHYVSATEPSRLMLCKIWGFHDGGYAERRLLRCKSPVTTSHETHYVSATVPSRLMLCKISGLHSGDYGECRLLLCYSVWVLLELAFFGTSVLKRPTWRNITEDGIPRHFLVCAKDVFFPSLCHNFRRPFIIILLDCSSLKGSSNTGLLDTG
jgi:hypothetical protein